MAARIVIQFNHRVVDISRFIVRAQKLSGRADIVDSTFERSLADDLLDHRLQPSGCVVKIGFQFGLVLSG